MKKQIWKFQVPDKEITIKMPINAIILTGQTQFGHLCIWALINPKNKQEERHFVVYGTGHEISTDNNLRYISTFQLNDGALVYHLFEKLK